MTVLRTWKRDGTHNLMPFHQAVECLLHNRHDLGDRDRARTIIIAALERGEVVCTNHAEFRLCVRQ